MQAATPARTEALNHCCQITRNRGCRVAICLKNVRDDLVLPRIGPSALHEIYLACATGRVLLIFVRFCRAAFHVARGRQVADFDFSFLVFRRLRLGRFISIIYISTRTPSTARRPHMEQIENPYYGGYDIYKPIANCVPETRPCRLNARPPRIPVAGMKAMQGYRESLAARKPFTRAAGVAVRETQSFRRYTLFYGRRRR
jgi:hypothetical protein